MWHIVQFRDGHQIIPNSWLSQDKKKAFWPNFTSQFKFNKAVQSQSVPAKDWVQHPVVKVKYSSCKFYPFKV
jgi:hypothetical protein